MLLHYSNTFMPPIQLHYIITLQANSIVTFLQHQSRKTNTCLITWMRREGERERERVRMKNDTFETLREFFHYIMKNSQ